MAQKVAVLHRTAPVLAVSVGGALGAVARYGLQTALPDRAGILPWATLAANLLGCLLIGALMVALTEATTRPHPLLRPFLGVGLLGGFTTFSTYAVEVDRLLAAGHLALAGTYLVGTVVGALLAVQVGIVAARGLRVARPGRARS